MKRVNLINARGERNQEDVAKECGVSQKTISHWECARVTPPVKKMVVLERLYGVPKEILFDDVFNSFNELNCAKNELSTTSELAATG